MKKVYIVLGLVMTFALSVSARNFYQGEELYVNMQQDFDWTTANAKLYLYFFGGSPDMWMTLTQENGKMYKGTFSSDCHYTGVKVVRENPNKTPHQWTDPDGVWTQTGDMEIPGDWNCIDHFDDAEHRWAMYSPAVSQISGYTGSLTADAIHVCPSALGCTIALRPKLNEDTTDYIYNKVTGHEWYVSTNGGSSWTAINAHGGATRAENDIDHKDLFVTLPKPLPTGGIYYYLHSSIPDGRHLVYIQDDAQDCDLDCEITAFQTAVSNVNADDNTYTLDGMVAFGKASGDLIISCDGKSVTISDPKSPQAFSLHGVPAATTDGKKTTATAYFTGDQANCSKVISIDVPNAKEAVAVVNVDSLTGKTFVLTPVDYDPANMYVWLADGDTIKGAPQVLVVDAYGKDSTTVYTYKEYYPASGSMDDIMDNGDYEDATWDYGTNKVSEYTFWGKFPETATSQLNFYTDTLPGGVNYPAKYKSDGFAVVCNANNFYPTYAQVSAKSGSHFALFDAATGAAGANKMAWYATTDDNSRLKLQNGTTYVLSFWAANINNYGEMDNAAKFKFYIEDITDPAHPVKIDSSEVLDLSQPAYRNHLWHQCSKTVQAKKDYNRVRISVVNLNNRPLKIGNDFALDDIQFHPISTVSKVVKSQQQFVVTAHEPKMDVFTATVVPLDCDAAPNYTVKMHAEYQNPKGQLIIKDVTTDTSYPYSVPAIAYDTKGTLDKDIVITGLTPGTHTWEAYFEDWPTAKISSVTTDAPVVPVIDTVKTSFSTPGCTDLTTTLTFDLGYTYQQGTLEYWVDEITPKASATYSVADKSAQTLTGLSFANIPADGKKTHVLHVSFNGANSCVKDYVLPAVPFSPVISSVTATVPTTVLCEGNDYSVSVTIVTPYDATGRNIVLSGAKDTTVAAAGTSTVISFKKSDIGGAAQTVTAAYEATPGCTKTSDPFTPPVHSMPVITVSPIGIVCDDETEIAMPLKVVSGSPDTYDIAIGTTHYAGTVSGTNLTFTLTPALAAGDYNVVVTASTSGTDCSSQVTVPLTIADGSRMLSKWTDVLFIDNSDGRFVSYQWYEDGYLMLKETQQRLYNPYGLTGTYYCKMTTVDGQVIYTCEQAFKDVTPSRSVSDDEPATVIRRYRVSPHVYIIQERIGDETVTRKILTEYE